jgi:uncharacterized protein (TIGR02118 family)
MGNKAAVKLIALLRRKPGLSMEEFIAYYEDKHVPLVLRIVPFIMDYRRSYVQHDSAIAALDGLAGDCDVITEAWFATHADFENFMTEGAKPENRELIIADELNFLDRTAIRMFLVDEHKSSITPIAQEVTHERL